MKESMRKILAALIVFALAGSCLPVSLSAEEAGTAVPVKSTDELVSGARYLIVPDGSEYALGDFNDGGDALELIGVTVNGEDGSIGGLTGDEYFILECVDEKYWTITTPGGREIAPLLSEEGASLDGLAEDEGSPWDLLPMSGDGMRFEFVPYDHELGLTLAADTENGTAYAAHSTDGLTKMFRLYICSEDAKDGTEPETVKIGEAHVTIPDIFCGDTAAAHFPGPGEEADPDKDYMNLPGVSVEENHLYDLESAFWVEPGEGDNATLGYVTVEEDFGVTGGEKYYVGIVFLSKYFFETRSASGTDFRRSAAADSLKRISGGAGLRQGEMHGYVIKTCGVFTEDTEFTADNAKCVASEVIYWDEEETMGAMALAVFEIEAQHVPGESVEENRVEPTCEDEGSYEDNTYCSECGELIETHEEMLEPLGHDWGDWVVTKEPTATEYGEETRTCKRDPSHVETRPIDPTGEIPDTGDGTAIAAWMLSAALSLGALLLLRRRVTG